MSKESLLKLLLEDTPRDELREVIQEIMKRDESIRDAVVRERVAEAAKQMEEQVGQVDQKRQERAARSEGTSTNGGAGRRSATCRMIRPSSAAVAPSREGHR